MEEKIAVVFPGQGTQRPGMGKDFYDNIKVSKDTYEEASDVLGWDVAGLCFGDDEKINLTEYAQPSIVATEIAMFRGIQELYGFKPHYFGGHSLGEYAGLVAADAIPFSETLKAVQTRGRLMQLASPPGTGGMAAVIGTDLDLEKIRESLEDLQIDVANINSTSQVVISGRADSIEVAEKRLILALGPADTANNFRFVPLNVSAPFHSRFMETMRETFQEVLTSISAKFNAGNASRVTSNYSGKFHSGNAAKIIEALVSQVSNSVNWRDNMTVLSEKAQKIYEIGPNRPLKNFFASINIPCKSITSFSSARRAFATGE
jgi:[acyl-carrier-protein] S-malonyltransferase